MVSQYLDGVKYWIVFDWKNIMTPPGPPPLPRLELAWLLLGLMALFLSSAFALFLVSLRTPWLGFADPGLFPTALVLHVNLAVVVWFLALAGLFWSLAAGERGRLTGWLAWLLAVVGTGAMIMAPLGGAATAVTSNYLPVLDSPVFLAGLAALGAGAGLAAGRGVLLAPWSGALPVVRWGAGAAALAALLGLGVLAFSYSHLPEGFDLHDRYEALFWGGGHVLQFTHTLLLALAWLLLAAAGGWSPRLTSWGAALLFAVGLAPALSVPWGLMLHPDPTSGDHRRFFTDLMAYGSWLAPPMALMAILAGVRTGVASSPARAALVISVLLFTLGLLVGSRIEGDTLMVTAHYHGTVGAVTVAYMGFAHMQLAQWGFPPPARGVGRQLVLYGVGVVLLVCGLGFSGSQGGLRKIPLAHDGAGVLATDPGLVLVGLGGVLGLAAAFLFLYQMVRTLMQGRGEVVPRRDRRSLVIVATTVVIAALGFFIQSLPSPQPESLPAPLSPLPLPERDPRLREAEERFQQGVAMLHAKRFDMAVVAFHRVLELYPELPEAHVNMGYALLGLENFQAALDFFFTASELNATQANAYYGMALVHERQGDLLAALGAMRTYLHLTHAGDPYQAKARAALWTWESQLGREGEASDDRK